MGYLDNSKAFIDEFWCISRYNSIVVWSSRNVEHKPLYKSVKSNLNVATTLVGVEDDWSKNEGIDRYSV
jgi:hypothetical protein